jgi:plastocyanin
MKSSVETIHTRRFHMNLERRLWVLAVVLTIGMGSYGCTSLPPNSRTAGVHDVKIEEALSADNLLVQPGDEIRFINLRKEAAQVEIPNLKAENLACEREFSNWMGSVGEIVVLKPNTSASLCFNKPIVVNYLVRVDTPVAGSKKVMKGVVTVGTPLSQ